MRTYVVQAGDSPASIAAREDMAGCPKCSVDLVWANPNKPRRTLANGYVTFESLTPGEKLNLPPKWFDGSLDRLPKGYFANLPSPDGVSGGFGVGRPQGLAISASDLASSYGISTNAAGQYAYNVTGLPASQQSTIDSAINAAANWSTMSEQQQTQTSISVVEDVFAAIPVYGWVLDGILIALTAAFGTAGGGPGCWWNGSFQTLGHLRSKYFRYVQICRLVLPRTTGRFQ